MKKLLCESIVYCDFLMIILGILIDNKAFICLFVHRIGKKISDFHLSYAKQYFPRHPFKHKVLARITAT